MLILSAIVFLYQAHIVMPDLATAFGELNTSFYNQDYHTPFGEFSAQSETQRYGAAAGMPPQTELNAPRYAPNYGQYSVSPGVYSGN